MGIMPIEPQIPCLKKAQSTSVANNQPHRRLVSFKGPQQSSHGSLKLNVKKTADVDATKTIESKRI